MNPDRFLSFIRGGKQKSDVPTFSLCHTTARLPDGWQRGAQEWFDAADHPETVEHIIAWDDGATSIDLAALSPFGKAIGVVNQGRKCAVDGWNAAARASSGKFIISLSDDLSPCPHWDTEILKVLAALPKGIDGDYVLEVTTGGDEGLLTFSMLTRGYFMRLSRDYGYHGGLFYPEYFGMYGDTDFTRCARRDKVVIDATCLTFVHRHPVYGTAQWDDTYRHQQRPEAYAVGREIYDRRAREYGFAPRMFGEVSSPEDRPKLVVCLPGADFSAAWVAAWTTLFAELMKAFNVAPLFCYNSNVHVTRASLAEAITKGPYTPDFVLWIDDDNILSVRNAFTLLENLRLNPKIDGVTGWCWSAADGYEVTAITSVGAFLPDGRLHTFTAQELAEGDNDLKEIGWTGFPAFAMRGTALVKAGMNPFAPIISDKAAWGFFSEDTSFCINARTNGCKFYVDRRVKVPHLKLRAADPQEMVAQAREISQVLEDAPETGSERKTA